MTKNHCYFRQFLVKTTFFYKLTLMTDPNFDEIPAYIPKKGEEFMSSGQLKHFIHKLNVWRDQLVSEAESTINHIQEDSTPVADINDRATIEEELLSSSEQEIVRESLLIRLIRRFT